MSGKLSDFTIIKKLGDGAYSSVFKVRRHDDNDVYALKKVKMLSLSEKEKENALNEVRILASIEHPSVIAYKDAFIDEPSSSLCLVMEYADNGDVFQKICSYQKRETYIKEKKIWYVFIQIVRGLRAFHARKILHRDMKSANIFLFKDMQAKLGDLNVSKIVKKGLSYTQTGTPYYASPEVWRDMPYDSKSDIWSLGCVLYEMCALVPPFRADDMQGLYKKVIKGKYPRIPDHFSQEMATVIKFMLQISPSYRPSCDQILALPIVESLSKKFFPEERQKLEEIDDGQQNLLKTIRISRNLFSLTERLPKNKYRGKSNDLARNQSHDIIGTGDSRSNQFKLKTIAAMQNQNSGLLDEGTNKMSSKSRSRPQVSQNGNTDEEMSDMVAGPGGAPIRGRGDITKPKHIKRNSEGGQIISKQRTLSMEKAKKNADKNDVVRGLSQSPSIGNIPTLNQVSEGNDDDQPQKPFIGNDSIGEDQNTEILPALAGKHRSIGGGKIPPSLLANENESQASNNNSPGKPSQIDANKGSGLRAPRGSEPQTRNIRRGDKVMQVYSHGKSQNSANLLYGPGGNAGPVLHGNKQGSNQVTTRGGRHKSTIRGANQPQQAFDMQYQGAGGGNSLHRHSSKPQLQLPEIGGARPSDPMQVIGDSRQNRLVSARANKHSMLSPVAQAANHATPGPLSPNKVQHIFDLIDRKSVKNSEKMQNDLTKIQMKQATHEKRQDGEWGTLPANALQRNGNDLQPIASAGSSVASGGKNLVRIVGPSGSAGHEGSQPQKNKIKMKAVKRVNQYHADGDDESNKSF